MSEYIVEPEESSDTFFNNITARMPADILVKPWSFRRTISGLALMTDFAAQQLRQHPFIDPRDIRVFADSIDLLLNCSADVPHEEIEALRGLARELHAIDGKNYRIHLGYRVGDAPHSSYRAIDLEFGMDAFYSMLSYYIAEAKNKTVEPARVYEWIDFMISREIQPWRDQNAAHTAVLIMLVMKIFREPIQRIPAEPATRVSHEELGRVYASL